MRDGAEGPAVAAAMDLLVRYGQALDAERLCTVERRRHHHPALAGQGPAGRRGRLGPCVLDHQPRRRRELPIPPMAVPTCQLQQGFGTDGLGGVPYPPEIVEIMGGEEAYYGEHGVTPPRHLHALPGRQPARAWRALRLDGVLGRGLRQLASSAPGPTGGQRDDRRREPDRQVPVLGPPSRRAPVRHGPGRGHPVVGNLRDWGLLGYCRSATRSRSAFRCWTGSGDDPAWSTSSTSARRRPRRAGSSCTTFPG